MSAIPYLSALSSIAALVLAFVFFGVVRRSSPGDDRMVEIMHAIQIGAKSFIRREYMWVGAMAAILAVVIAITLPDGHWRAVAFLAGAGLSALAGYIGMTAATMANARTAEAAKSGPQLALPLAFRGGAVMGFSVAGLSLLGASLSYILFVDLLELAHATEVVTSYVLGCGVVALTARIGGGIYTKAADVGADLVGKVEAGIPEDDPRNPATIADNVGDNVGDVAGMGADLFESHAGSVIAPIALASFVFAGLDIAEPALLFPLAIASVGMLAAIIGAFTISTSPDASGKQLARALHRGTNVSSVITIVATFVVGYVLFRDVEEVANWWALPLAVLAGLVVGLAIGKLSEFYTSEHYSPVRKIADAAETGPATTVLAGVAWGKRSVVASVLLVAAGVGIAYAAGQHALPDIDASGVYGVAIAGIGMLATLAVVVGTDAYGPITDNAGGIAEMAGLDPSVRKVTDELDSLGNTTAAIAKGFAIGSAVLAALALFVSFQRGVEVARADHGVAAADVPFLLDIGNTAVFIGVFIGGMLPFWFASRTIESVGKAAHQMIGEVRRQFATIPGLREGEPGVVPDYARCVAISTDAALREMVLPGAIAVLAPLIVGFISLEALGGMLAGALATGFAIAIYMANAGGAWDNAKKYIEAGAHGGKGGEPHKAAVVGDTVGDPFKDTSGPAMSTLIKLMTVVSLTFTPIFVSTGLGG